MNNTFVHEKLMVLRVISFCLFSVFAFVSLIYYSLLLFVTTRSWLCWLRLMPPNSHDLSSTLPANHIFFFGIFEFHSIYAHFFSILCY